MTNDRCPKCGAKSYRTETRTGAIKRAEIWYLCGTYELQGDSKTSSRIWESETCLRNQLANVTKEYESAKKALDIVNAERNAMLPVVVAAIGRLNMQYRDSDLAEVVEEYQKYQEATTNDTDK